MSVLSTMRWRYTHSDTDICTQFSTRTHICFPILASWTLPAKLAFLFLIVSAKTWLWSCSVSVCRRLWVPSCIFLFPSIFSSVSLSPTPFPSLSFSAQLSLCFFITFAFYLFSCKSLPPSFPLALSLPLWFFLSFSLFLQAQVWLRYSTVC